MPGRRAHLPPEPGQEDPRTTTLWDTVEPSTPSPPKKSKPGTWTIGSPGLNMATEAHLQPAAPSCPFGIPPLRPPPEAVGCTPSLHATLARPGRQTPAWPQCPSLPRELKALSLLLVPGGINHEDCNVNATDQNSIIKLNSEQGSSENESMALYVIGYTPENMIVLHK